jgi:hypothetical protein
MNLLTGNHRPSWIRSVVALALLTGVALAAGSVLAQTTPQVIKVQGFLSDISGSTPVPANGSHSILFDFFDAPSGGTLIVSVGPLLVDVSDGRYETALPLSALLFEEPDRYLEMTINGELLSPRIRLVSVPYAFSSARADSVAPESIDTDALAEGAVTLDKLGIVCADGEILIYTVGAGWSCAPQAGSATVCEIGSFVSCYTGPEGTLGVGICLPGQAACRTDQSGFDGCSGDIGPQPEVCDNILDDDCDSLEDCLDDDCTGHPACSGCPDADSDGYFDSACGGADCNDGNASVNPAAFDICDGVDNDCDPASNDGDEDPQVGTACDGTDSDLCLEGTNSCSAGSLSCSDNTGDNLDVCDGSDNDCDPSSTDGSEDPLVGTACDGTDSDLCLEGVNSCSSGSLACDDTTSDTLDVCDGVDNDCDPASTDGSEDPLVGTACDGTDSDLCVEGTNSCSAGSLSCSDSTGDNLDICDGADNDCDPASNDGDEDPLLGTACDGADGDLCPEGTNSCSSGSLACDDTTSDTLDVCDGVDNDCDPSSTDGSEDPLFGSACDGTDSDLCLEGTNSCSAGSLSCSDNTGDSNEVCASGTDEDCDTVTDEFDCVSCGTVDDTITCSTDLNDTTVGASAELNGYACATGTPQPGAEKVYEFTPQASGSVTANLTGATADLDLYVLDEACSPDLCIASSNDSGTTGEVVTFDAVAGTTYYIVVESFGGESGFALSFESNTQGCPEDCDDSIDNDGDSYPDCSDSDCAADPVCGP